MASVFTICALLADNWQAVGSVIAIVMIASRWLINALRTLIKLLPNPEVDSLLEILIAMLEGLIWILSKIGAVTPAVPTPAPAPSDPASPSILRRVLLKLLTLS